jgi:hypothetical protein
LSANTVQEIPNKCYRMKRFQNPGGSLPVRVASSVSVRAFLMPLHLIPLNVD